MQPAERVRVALGERVELVYDPARYDAAAKVLELPIRPRNVSPADIYSPIVVEIEKVNSDADASQDDPAVVLNASNGKHGDGGAFDYSASLGDLPALPPGAITNAVVWRVRVSDPLKTPAMRIRAWGHVAR